MNRAVNLHTRYKHYVTIRVEKTFPIDSSSEEIDDIDDDELMEMFENSNSEASIEVVDDDIEEYDDSELEDIEEDYEDMVSDDD